MLEAAAVVPVMRTRIDEPRDVARLRLKIDGVDTAALALDGAGQQLAGDVLTLVDPRDLRAGPIDPDRARYLRPETLIESDDPEIVAEALRMVAGVDRHARSRRAARA